MAEYIKRDILMDRINGTGYAEQVKSNFLFIARMIPVADVVERKHGKWTLNKDGSGTCSECGRVQFNCWDLDNWDNFCHFCGADMRGTVVLNPITTEEIQHVGYDDEQMGREK